MQVFFGSKKKAQRTTVSFDLIQGKENIWKENNWFFCCIFFPYPLYVPCLILFLILIQNSYSKYVLMLAKFLLFSKLAHCLHNQVCQMIDLSCCSIQLHF